jgi:hypothetical protein
MSTKTIASKYVSDISSLLFGMPRKPAVRAPTWVSW